MGALSAAVSGLKVHQTMLDVAGNNLANVNTIGYKASSTTFSELLSQTIKKASAPAGSCSPTSPVWMLFPHARPRRSSSTCASACERWSAPGIDRR